MARQNEIRLYGPIGSYPAFGAEELAQSIPPDAKEITVRINSPGGDVSEGFAIYNYLRDHQAKVTTIVDGIAASAASLVMLAGDVRQVHGASVVMVHNPWTMAVGNADELRQTASTLDVFSDAMMEIYTARTGQPADMIKELLSNESYIKGSTAIEMGFADQMIDAPEQAKIAAMVEPYLHRTNTTEYTMAKNEQAKETPAPVAEVEQVEPEAANPTVEVKFSAEQMQEIKDEIASVKAEVEKARAERDNAFEALAELRAENESMIEQIAEISAERDKLQAAVSNPANVDAAMVAAKVEDVSISDAEADKLDAQAETEAETSNTPHWDAYNELSGAEQTAYWKANKEQLQAELRANANA